MNTDIETGKIIAKYHKQRCIELIQNTNEKEAVFQPFAKTGWGASPFNIKCWKKINGEQLIELRANNRTRKQFSQKEKVRILKKTNGRCFSCGISVDLNRMQVAHIIPFSRGGSDEYNNLLPSCRKCNMYRSNYNPYRIHDILQIGNIILNQIRNESDIGKTVDEFLSAHKNKLRARNNKNRIKRKVRKSIHYQAETDK